MRHRLITGAAAFGAAAAGYAVVARSWHLHWGATVKEPVAVLPGDEFIPEPDLVATRAIAVRAPASDVWPWIVQLGQGRGGFYSYESLENLVGCDIHNADRIVADWQTLAVGDEVRLHPEVGLMAAVVKPGEALVLRGGVPMSDVEPPYDFTWAFVVQEQLDGTARLLVRERYAYKHSWTPLLVEPVELISFIMTQKMMRGIRDRAEKAKAAPAE